MAFTLPDLPYAYDALAPVISEEIMRLHHTKHHQGYVDKLNNAVQKYPDLLGDKSLDYLLTNIDSLPEDIRTTVRNNGGGHYNHSLFWQVMSPKNIVGQSTTGSSQPYHNQPSGELLNIINDRYGDFNTFVEEFTTKALGLFGSGWVWLMPNADIITTPNQDSPLMLGPVEPILGLDVWEHAYYLDYNNDRSNYIKNWWRVVNWQFVQTRSRK